MGYGNFAATPPSHTIVWPLTYDERSDARKSSTDAMSAGTATRRTGVFSMLRCLPASYQGMTYCAILCYGHGAPSCTDSPVS